MRVSIQEICQFINGTPQSKNFTGGENIINQGHLLNCGKVSEVDNCLKIIAFCLQSSSIRDDPHEINGEVLKDGKIVGMSCSCKAGLSGACKHVAATLFYLNRNDLENLKIISCTDKKCVWNAPKQSALQQYDMNPLMSHRCFVEKIKTSEERKKKDKKKRSSIPDDLDVALQVIEDVNHAYLSGPTNTDANETIESLPDSTLDTVEETDDEEYRRMMIEDNPSSALAMHISGRHDPVEVVNNNIIISADKVIAIIKSQETSKLLMKLNQLNIKILVKDCCKEVLSRLSCDIQTICEETYKFHSVWLKERQLRITASNAYRIYTYRNNKNPDWKKKSLDYFFGVPFSNSNTQYGIENESLAREVYKEKMSVEVIQCGFIVSKLNPWLGCSPDGVIFKDNKPSKILEIKCPIEGKKKSVDDTIKQIKWLEVKHGQVNLKKKHLYYAQAQINMALVNVPLADFLIYSSFDKTFKIIPISFDYKYTQDLLCSLKFLYFKFMLHNICEKELEQASEE